MLPIDLKTFPAPTRRDFLHIGTHAALGLGLADFLRLRATADESSKAKAKAKACILIWLDGGPSHLETFDPKPDAPREVRGPFAPIATKLPGVQVGECLPELAQRLERFALLRSMTSPLGEHDFGTHYLLTGYKPSAVLEYPSYGSIVAALDERPSALPAHIAVPHFRVGGGRLSGHGFLPESAAPFAVGGDPAKPDFRVADLDFFPGLTVERLERRRQFLAAFDRFAQAAEQKVEQAADANLEKAFRLVTSAEAKAAFDLAAEEPRVRERYGPRTIGQSCLLARRLVERGVPFVTVNHSGWDTHADLVTRLKDGYTGAREPVGLIPSLDQAVSALTDDLAERGMLDQTLIVIVGEFGRTPKLNTQGGRDHWPRVFSAALAGGGIAGGHVHGASDATGESPRDRPVTPADLGATILSLLGIDPQTQLQTADGRPVAANRDGRVIRELIG